MEIVRIIHFSNPYLILILGSYRRTYDPRSYHIAQELQKYNIPDYRPRQEQSVIAQYFSLPIAQPVTGSRKRLRKSVRSSVCVGIVALRSAKQRMQGGRIKPA
jgi:hypothetical protein